MFGVMLNRRQLRTTGSAGKVILPMNRFAAQVIETVAANQFCTIIGQTGSGKTTQVPQILLDKAIHDGMGSAINIICTQPRRIAATSVARRVAAERREELGHTVGYHIRHETVLPRYGGSITYCTTGILLKQLQSPDEVLDGVSHIVLDEVHERDISLDFTLIMLKRSFIERARIGKPIPKLILMSATIDTGIFQHYFADPRLGPLAAQCPALHVPGRTFPVQRHYLNGILNTLVGNPKHFAPLENDLDRWIRSESSFERHQVNKSVQMPPLALFSTVIAHVVKTTQSGAILVFLPGLAEIRDVKTLLTEGNPLNLDFKDATKFQVYQLHSLIEEDQRTVFHESAPGIRKIILATNIAETSITIPDVTIVIDSGLIRQMQYDSTRRISELRTVFVSQSNISQRAGRAGRVQAGSYYGLFHEDRMETLSPLPIPEMRLTDLADLGLTIRAQQNPAPIAEFLADAVEPPPQKAVDAAVSDLIGLGAITKDEMITNLGQVLAKLPLHPALGKLIILGILFECLDPIIILGTAAESSVWERGTLETEGAANAMRFRFAEGTFSEHFALLHAYRDLRAAIEQSPGLNTYAWCRNHFLRPIAMHHIDQGARQVEEILAEAGLIRSVPVRGQHGKKMFNSMFGPPYLNANSRNKSLIRAVLAAGLQPNMAWGTFAKSGHLKSFATPHARRLGFAMSWLKMLPLPSIPKSLKSKLPLMLFDASVFTDKTKSTFLSTVTPVSPLVAALFGDQPRAPSNEDKAWMDSYAKYQNPGNFVLGRANPSDSEERTGRLVMFVRSAAQEAEEDDKARDALLRLRERLDRTLDRVLCDLARGRPVEGDPEWRGIVDGLVRLVGADDWDGLEKAMQIIREEHGRAAKVEEQDDEDEW